MSWHRERLLKRFGITVAFACICLALARLVINQPPPFIDSAALQELLAGLGGWIVQALAVIRLPDNKLLEIGANTALLGVMVAALAAGWGWLSPLLHDHAFASFDRDTLRRITRVSDDGRLPWELGESGLRREGWDVLTGWIHGLGSAKGRFGDYPVTYKMAIIAGRAGSGKTRFSEELGLSLARLAQYQPETRLARARLATGAWLRRVVPGLKPQPGDPWDIGRFGQKDSGRNQEEYARDLAEWMPRRPTMLLLDDPAGDEVAQVHLALSRQGNDAFRYPVVLLIANQTIPQGCPLHYDPASRSWTFDSSPAEPQPVMLPVESWFDEPTVRRLVMSTLARDGLPDSVKKDIRDGAIFRITLGNPLLVSLAVEWLSDKWTLAGMSEDSLKAERARRIIIALRAAGIDSADEFRELLVATLAGGTGEEDLRKAMAAAELLTGQSIFSRAIDAVKPCFPSDEIVGRDGALVLPPVRPEMIIGPFCEAVLIDYAMAAILLDKVVIAACHLDLPRTLRTRRRISAKSALGLAFGRIDPERLPGLSQLQWALAEAEAALFIEHDELGEWTQAEQDARIARADAAIARMQDGEQRIAFCERVAALAANRRGEFEGGRRLLPHLALRFVHLASQPDTVSLPAAFWTRFYVSLAGTAGKQASELPGPIHGPCRAATLIAEAGHMFALVDAAWGLGSSWHHSYAPLFQALATAREKKHVSEDVFASLQIAYQAALSDADAAESGAKALPASLTADQRTALAQARAWRYVAYAWYDRPQGAAAAETGAAATNVGAIAARFPEDAAIQKEAAEARRCEAYAWSLRPLGASATEVRAAADIAATIADQFPEDVAIQKEAAQARKCEAYTWSERPHGAAATEASASADIVATIAARFPENAAIQREAAQSRRFEAYAWSCRPLGAAATRARASADIVATIAGRIPEDASVQKDAAEARRCEAYAWGQRPNDSAAAVEAQAAADIIAAIAARFPEDATIQKEAAQARRHEAHAWCQRPQGEAAAKAQAAADALAVIAARFQHDAAIQTEAAFARKCEAAAWCFRPKGEGAVEARAAADIAADIAERFPHHALVQFQSANARRYEAYAWSGRPQGEGAAEARAAADVVATIAAKFPDDTAIQREVAEARKCEAFAWSERPHGAAAADARVAADIVAAIAARFPKDAAIQFEAIEARRIEAYAWSERPRGEAATEARAAADIVAAIAAQFPLDARMRENARKASYFAGLAEAARRAD